MSEPDQQEPLPAQPPAQFPVLPLDYRSSIAEGRNSRMSGGQIALGFACWVVAVFAAVTGGATINSVWFGFLCLVAILVPMSIYTSKRLGWRGFIPGIMIGAAATCLLPLGIAAVVCGPEWVKQITR
jgi:hypothetical protein